MRRAGLLLLLAALLAQQQRCRGGGAQSAAPLPAAAEAAAPQALPVPREFLITNDTLASFLRRLASPAEQAIIFTTTRLPDSGGGGELAMLSNFCRWLDRAGVLGHTMVLTTNNATFHTLHARGLPVFLDRLFPERQEVFDVQKHYWGAAIVAHGFRALYMDSDAVVLKNPLPWFDAGRYDVQGLSDWGSPELPRVGDVLHTSCGLYAMVPEGRVGVGAMLREWWRYAPGDKERALNFHNPCQSTGVWFVEPTPMAIRFMAAMRDRLLAPATRHQWDQTAWNEVLIPFLWGAGEEPPLRHRLLPAALFFGGVHNYERRLQAGLAVDPVVLHAGGLHGSSKQATYQRMGLFYADFSLPARPAMGVAGTVSAGLHEGPEAVAVNAPAAPQGPGAVAAAPLPPQQQPLMAAGGLMQQTKAVLTARSRGGSSTGVLALAAALAAAGAAMCSAGLLTWRRARRGPPGQARPSDSP